MPGSIQIAWTAFRPPGASDARQASERVLEQASAGGEAALGELAQQLGHRRGELGAARWLHRDARCDLGLGLEALWRDGRLEGWGGGAAAARFADGFLGCGSVSRLILAGAGLAVCLAARRRGSPPAWLPRGGRSGAGGGCWEGSRARRPRLRGRTVWRSSPSVPAAWPAHRLSPIAYAPRKRSWVACCRQ